MGLFIPPPLRSYTGGRARLDLPAPTLGDLVNALDARYPGLRFRVIDEQDRIRPHVRFFVNGEQVFTMTRSLRPADELQIVQALSGG